MLGLCRAHVGSMWGPCYIDFKCHIYIYIHIPLSLSLNTLQSVLDIDLYYGMCLLDYIYSVVDLYLELRYILYTYAYTHNVQHVWLMHQRVARFVEAEYQQLSTAQLKDEAGVS